MGRLGLSKHGRRVPVNGYVCAHIGNASRTSFGSDGEHEMPSEGGVLRWEALLSDNRVLKSVRLYNNEETYCCLATA